MIRFLVFASFLWQGVSSRATGLRLSNGDVIEPTMAPILSPTQRPRVSRKPKTSMPSQPTELPTSSPSQVQQMDDKFIFKRWMIDGIMSIATQWVAPLLQDRKYRHLFTFSTSIYWLFYDNMKHSYISHIYSADKYGVVINYAVINLMKIFEMHNEIDSAEDRLGEQSSRDQGKTRTELREELRLYKSAVTFLALSKVLVFNFIFKNHTDDDRYHQLIHVGFVFVLGTLTILSESFYFHFRPKLSISYKASKLFITAVAFQLLGLRSKSVNFEDPMLNFFTMILESILVEETV